MKKRLANFCLFTGVFLIGFVFGIGGTLAAHDIKADSKVMEHLLVFSLLLGAALFTIGVFEHEHGRNPK